MREFENVKVIAVDHGYGNIKTVNTVTPTGITAYQTKPAFSGNILEYNGVYYRVGEDHKEFVADKYTDEDFYLLTLMAVARELNIAGIQEADVYLAAGLPMKWIGRQREEFRAYLLRNEEVEYRFNDKDYHVRFTGCSLFPQGYPAILNLLGQLVGTSLLVDIGNGTMNVLYLQGKKPVESRCWTEKFGVNQCMIAAKNALLDNLGVKMDDATVERVLRFGTADIDEAYQECIIASARAYVSEIFATLRKYEYDPGAMRLYVVGGGGCLVKNFGEYNQDRVTILEDICATARGYEYLAFTKLRRKSAA